MGARFSAPQSFLSFSRRLPDIAVLPFYSLRNNILLLYILLEYYIAFTSCLHYYITRETRCDRFIDSGHSPARGSDYKRRPCAEDRANSRSDAGPGEKARGVRVDQALCGSRRPGETGNAG